MNDRPARAIRETSGPTVLTVGAIADGSFLRRVATGLVAAVFWSLLADHFYDPRFGSGILGNVTLVGPVTLDDDSDYHDLELNGQTLTVAGCAIRGTGTLTGTGTIARNGGGGVGLSGGSADGGAVARLGAGQAGSNGGNNGTNGANRSAQANCAIREFAADPAGKGGVGGVSGGVQTGGTVATPTAHAYLRGGGDFYTTGHSLGSGNIVQKTGGGGGSGGGAQANSTGGGGGCGGGLILIWFRIWDSPCTVSANGGAGAAASLGAGAGAGGGGGGGGGYVAIMTMRFDDTPTITVNGGAGGALAGAGAVGNAGNTGYYETFELAAA